MVFISLSMLSHTERFFIRDPYVLSVPVSSSVGAVVELPPRKMKSLKARGSPLTRDSLCSPTVLGPRNSRGEHAVATHTPVIPEFGSHRQEDSRFRVSCSLSFLV